MHTGASPDPCCCFCWLLLLLLLLLERLMLLLLLLNYCYCLPQAQHIDSPLLQATLPALPRCAPAWGPKHLAQVTWSLARLTMVTSSDTSVSSTSGTTPNTVGTATQWHQATPSSAAPVGRDQVGGPGQAPRQPLALQLPMTDAYNCLCAAAVPQVQDFR